MPPQWHLNKTLFGGARLHGRECPRKGDGECDEIGQGARRNVRAFAEHPQRDLRGDIGSRGANGPKKSAWHFTSTLRIAHPTRQGDRRGPQMGSALIGSLQTQAPLAIPPSPRSHLTYRGTPEHKEVWFLKICTCRQVHTQHFCPVFNASRACTQRFKCLYFRISQRVENLDSAQCNLY